MMPGAGVMKWRYLLGRNFASWWMSVGAPIPREALQRFNVTGGFSHEYYDAIDKLTEAAK